MSVKMQDVAKAAGLSIATVSRVINEVGYVDQETKSRTQEAIAKLNYVPLRVRKQKAKGLSRLIGILIPDIQNLYYSSVVRTLEQELARQSFSLIICNTDEKIDAEKKYIGILRMRGVDGIIFIGTRHARIRYGHIVDLAKKMPVLMINDFLVGSNVYSIMADETEGAYKAVTYLLELGHSRIAYMRGIRDLTTYRYKQKGYERALRDKGLSVDPRYIKRTYPFEKGGYEGAKELLRLKEPPHAFFTADDQMALGVVKAIFEAGFSIPKDFSIVGFTNIPLAANLYPGLTTVNQFPEKTGRIAADIIARIVNGEELLQRRILIEPVLVQRESCRSRTTKAK